MHVHGGFGMLQRYVYLRTCAMMWPVNVHCKNLVLSHNVAHLCLFLVPDQTWRDHVKGQQRI